ncbi:hypothetical protein KUTeg_005061 [Tegillarca granosa]|uniref:J domain-containing protein n=1 Tax=Tegillarca granosa TaxID=220873 RepID=A0ABQ9FMI9_TEGGR|nr:hypothetical protein KUTeg_005061 [Tegillarca granosa]
MEMGPRRQQLNPECPQKFGVQLNRTVGFTMINSLFYLVSRNMNLSREEAYDILELPVGTDFDSIRTAYKRLALKWHPDKHDSSAESIKI